MGPRRLLRARRLRARRLRARQPGKALLRRYRRLTAWLWHHRLQVPAVHNKFRRRPSKRRAVKLHRDGFFLSWQKRKIIVAPENGYDIVATFAAREARVNHEGHAAAVVGHRNGYPVLGSSDAR